MRRRQSTDRRPGFTLIELMVSMALILFIMSILAEAFSSGTETFRVLKGVGDLQDKLRTAATIMKRDLAADHFQGKARLSDPNFWQNGPPTEGFFRIYQGSAPPVFNTKAPPPIGFTMNPALTYQIDGVDPTSPTAANGTPQVGFCTFRTVDHALHFSVKYRGNTQGDMLSTSLPGNSRLLGTLNDNFGPDSRFQDFQNATATSIAYRYPWSEVSYFLRRQVGPAPNFPQDTTDGQVGLFTLYRAQALCVTDNSLIPLDAKNLPIQATLRSSYLGMSCYTDPTNTTALYFNNPTDLTVPGRRYGVGNPSLCPNDPTQATQSLMAGLMGKTEVGTGTLVYPTLTDLGASQVQQGSDMLLSDVLSMDTKVLLAGGTDFVDLYDPTVAAFSMNNPAFSNANGPRVFDTWTQVTDNAYDYVNIPTTINNPKLLQGGAISNPGNLPLWQLQIPNNATPAQNINYGTIPLFQNSAGQTINIKAIQITLRIWDSKTRQTRQLTIVQDL